MQLRVGACVVPYSVTLTQEEFAVEKPLARINWLSMLVFLLLAGGLSALTVYLTVEAFLDVALAIALLFAVLGGIAYAFFEHDEGRGWRVVAALNWLGALASMTVYVTVAGWLHPALAAAIYAFLAAGLVLYVRFRRNNAKGKELSPAQRDMPPRVG
jgi:hypothetical protein